MIRLGIPIKGPRGDVPPRAAGADNIEPFMSLPQVGLLGRIVMALCLVGLAPLAILAWQLAGENRVALTDQVIQTHAVAARTAADRTEAFVAPVIERAADLAANPVVNSSPGSSEGAAVLSASLQGLNGALGIQVRNTSGEVAAGVVVRGAGEAVNAVLRDPAATRLALIAFAGKPYLRVSEPLRDAEGVVELVIDAEGLTSFLASREIGEEAMLALFDRDGALVSGSASGVSVADFPRELLTAGQGGKAAGSGRYSGASGNQVLGAYAPVGATGWFVASRQPSNVADRFAERLQRRSLIALGLSVGLVALMGSFAYTSLVRPVRTLIEAQRKLLRTSAVPVPRGSRRPGGEISELAAAFETIEQRIHDQEALGEVFIGRFQVVKLLGAGAMGSVFRGYDPKLRRGVALKTIRLGIGLPEADRKHLVARLLKEAVTVAQFNHPNIVDIYDVEDTPEAAFIAMELVEGISLDHRLQQGPRLGLEATVPMAAQVARALEAAHAAGIVHQDVKPANVLLGFNGSVKVTDFGIAELVSTLENRTDGVWGTLGYLPPETVWEGSYDESGDVFGLGAVLYECLSGGRPAICGENADELTENTSKITPLRAGGHDVPAWIDDLVMAMLAPSRDQRIRTMKEVAGILESRAAAADWRWTANFVKESHA